MAGWKSVDEIVAYQVSVTLRDKILHLLDSGAIPHNYRFREDLAAAARSVPDNISEGFDLYGHGLFGRHVNIAKGSLGEIGAQLDELQKRGFLTDAHVADLERLLVKARRTTSGLLRHLKTTKEPPPWSRPNESTPTDAGPPDSEQ
jgi:four helix bundle protein